jgi:hypothetical protein
MQPDALSNSPTPEDRPLPAKIGDSFWVNLGILLALPPMVGYVIIGLVLFGGVDGAVLDSGAAMSTALLVGALLVLAPPVIYIANSRDYNRYMRALRKQTRRLSGAGDPVNDAQPGQNS